MRVSKGGADEVPLVAECLRKWATCAGLVLADALVRLGVSSLMIFLLLRRGGGRIGLARWSV